MNEPPAYTAEPSGKATCATCGNALHGRYCHTCGERALEPDEFRLRRFLSHSIGAVFDVDSRLFRSFRMLITRPGLLTADYIAGRRRPYLNPLQLFLIANLVFFAGLTAFGGVSTFTTELRYHTTQFGYRGVATELIARQGPAGSAAAAAFEERFNEAVPRYANSMVIVLAPILAGAFALLLSGRAYGFVHHLVFALHFLAFLLLVLLVFPVPIQIVLTVAPARPSDDITEVVFSTILLAVFLLYLGVAMRRAYGSSRRRTLLAAAVATALLLPALVVYRMILFFAVYASLR